MRKNSVPSGLGEKAPKHPYIIHKCSLITYLTKINCLNVAKVVGIPRLLFKVPMNPTMESTYYAIFDFSNEYVFKSAVIKFKLAAPIVLVISDHLVSVLARQPAHYLD